MALLRALEEKIHQIIRKKQAGRAGHRRGRPDRPHQTQRPGHSRLGAHGSQPVCPAGRVISQSFWGKAWCRRLETYADHENRIGRGRRYVRNSAVCHLEASAGRIGFILDLLSGRFPREVMAQLNWIWAGRKNSPGRPPDRQKRENAPGAGKSPPCAKALR